MIICLKCIGQMDFKMFDVERYIKENNVNEIIEILSKKPVNFIDIVSKEYVNDIKYEDDECRFRVIEFFDLKNTVPTPLLDQFKEENKLIANLKNIVRALYIVADPRTVIPDHYDEDDTNFRIAIGVYSESTDLEKVALRVEDNTVNLSKNVFIGIDASVDIHGGWNHTDQYWIMLVLIVKK